MAHSGPGWTWRTSSSCCQDRVSERRLSRVHLLSFLHGTCGRSGPGRRRSAGGGRCCFGHCARLDSDPEIQFINASSRRQPRSARSRSTPATGPGTRSRGTRAPAVSRRRRRRTSPSRRIWAGHSLRGSISMVRNISVLVTEISNEGIQASSASGPYPRVFLLPNSVASAIHSPVSLAQLIGTVSDFNSPST